MFFLWMEREIVLSDEWNVNVIIIWMNFSTPSINTDRFIIYSAIFT